MLIKKCCNKVAGKITSTNSIRTVSHVLSAFDCRFIYISVHLYYTNNADLESHVCRQTEESTDLVGAN